MMNLDLLDKLDIHILVASTIPVMQGYKPHVFAEKNDIE